jgi:AraC-like DNA-binding protein
LKANYQKLPLDMRPDLFMDFWVRSDYFGFHWHYHPEIEICYVKNGFGQRLIGESIERFAKGDLAIVGSNLPHCWITDDVFNQSEEQMEIFVIQIDVKKLASLLAVHEFSKLKIFLEQAKSGFAFDVKEEIILFKTLKRFEETEGLTKTLVLFDLLDLMRKAQTKRQLCQNTYIPETGKLVEERILNVCQHIHEHYKDKIILETLANIANMNVAAFCRFFKKVIGKTAVEYINELRINAACSELIVSDKPINTIAYDNGFLSLSHFNKLFRLHNERTPSEFRAVYR